MESVIVSVAMVVVGVGNLALWREVKRLRAENKMLRAQRELLAEVFRSVATDWMALLDSQVGGVQYVLERMSDDECRQLLNAVKEAGRDDANSTAE